MTLNRRKLGEWVARRALTPPMATRFVLYHDNRHGLSQVAEVALVGGPEDWPDHVSRFCYEESEQHVEAWPGRQQYVVRALADGCADPVGEYPFALTASPHTGEPTASIALCTPDYEGAMEGKIPLQDFSHPHAMVMAQQMRHNEALMKFLADMTMHGRDRDGDVISRQQVTIDKLEAGRFKVVEMIEDMLGKKQERNIIQEKWETDKRRKEQLMAKLLQFVVPEIAKRAGLAGAALVGGAGDDSVADEIKQLFLKLPAEMQNEIIAELPEEDGNRLLSIFEGRETKH